MARIARLLAAITLAIGVLTAPAPALASPGPGPGAHGTGAQPATWYDPAAPAAPLGQRDPAGQFPSASGGGCANTYGAGTCISYWGSKRQLNGDLYVNAWSNIGYGGTAYVYVAVNYTYYYKYSSRTYSLGRYPTVTHYAPGSGVAWTAVDFYNSAGTYLMTAYSPNQYYP
ncbi:hypothetical protein [Longispora albida]|uniref:hypothetical protein n=1 Tax=Longispora albida TaxID=203523 RepID=UPI00036E7685|nr:hypothetical protein [Longispora albida]